MSRIFLSHSSTNNREAVALKEWLSGQRPELTNEIFLDISEHTGLQPGQRWKDALRRANDRCEAVICLLSRDWQDSSECKTEYRTAETLGKRILVGRLEDIGDSDITSEWQRCDLFAEGAQTEIAVSGGSPVRFNSAALDQLKKAIEGTGISPEHFVWPPSGDRDRAPYRGWEPFEGIDAGVFFGRDAAILRGLDKLGAMRVSGVESLFVVLGPSGSGKSSFLRAGLVPRLQRDDRRFVVLGTMRPERSALTGDHGFAAAIASACQALKLPEVSLGEIKNTYLKDHERLYELLMRLRAAAAERLRHTGHEGEMAGGQLWAPTLLLPLDQAEELFSADAGEQAEQFLELAANLIGRLNATETGLIVAATIRTDSYEAMQNHPALDGVGTLLFNELKPMPATQFERVISGPAARATEAGDRLTVAADLIQQLIADAAEGADTLPLLALTMARLYTDYASTGELTLTNYESMGGMRDVVKNEIEHILSGDPHPRQAALDLLRSAFIPWLATINRDTDQPMRRVARWVDLPEASRPLIEQFVAKRLLARDERDGQVVVEVALESLLRQWDDLAEWLDEDRGNLRTTDDVQRAAAAWQASDRDEAWLLEGSRLAAAEALTRLPGYRELLVEASDFLAAAQQREQDRRAQQHQPTVLVGSSLSWLDRRWRLPRMRGHVVVCGLGGVGTSFLRDLRDNRIKTVVIEMDGMNPSIELCRSMGVPVIIGDARQRRILLTAGAYRASRVLAVTADDAFNTQIVATWREIAARRSTGLACLARIADPEFCMLLRVQEAQRGDKLSVDFFNTDEVGARLLFEEFPFDTDCVQPHILVAHLDPLGVWLVYHAARAWHENRGDSRVPLIITVVDHEPRQRVAALLRQHRALKYVCEFIVVSLSDNGIDRLGEDPRGPATPMVNHAYVTGKYDEEAFETALKLRRALNPDVPVVVALSQPQGIAGLIADSKAAGMLPNFDVFPALERTCTTEFLQGGSIELMARALHDAWRGEQLATGRPAPLWDELDEARKEVSRSQARDIPVKLRMVHCTLAPLSDWDATDFTFTAKEVEHLAIAEHDRWRTDRLADGWNLGDADVERKKSPYLVPWDQLPPEVAEFDRLYVRAIPTVLASAGLQVMRTASAT